MPSTACCPRRALKLLPGACWTIATKANRLKLFTPCCPPQTKNPNLAQARCEICQAVNPEQKQAEAQWRVNVAQAAQQARSMGDVPEGLKRLVEDVLYPKIDWRVLLRHFIEQAARNDYSWLPPSRRYLSQGIYLPSLHSKELGRIVIAIDTSGSIDTAALTQFSAEVSAVLEEYDTMSCPDGKG
jgi:predicted metal-dependent peptidase